MSTLKLVIGGAIMGLFAHLVTPSIPVTQAAESDCEPVYECGPSEVIE